jgi:hypothetical protein
MMWLAVGLTTIAGHRQPSPARKSWARPDQACTSGRVWA